MLTADLTLPLLLETIRYRNQSFTSYGLGQIDLTRLGLSTAESSRLDSPLLGAWSRAAGTRADHSLSRAVYSLSTGPRSSITPLAFGSWL